MPEFHEVQCTRCGLCLAPELFDKNKNRKNGLAVWCKYCMAAYRVANREKNVAYQSEYRKNNPDKLKDLDARKYITSGRRHHLEKRYGISEDIYNQMLSNQSGCCAICRSSDPGKGLNFFCVDHDHITRHVRGLLCVACNVALGKFKDDPNLLREAASYLDRDKSVFQ